MNIAFYVSRKATRLKKILDDNNVTLLQNIKVVFSEDKETLYLKEKLEKLGIEYVLYRYEDIIKTEEKTKNHILSDKMLEVFRKYSIDYCFCFGSHILKGELLSEYENRIINFHPSLLPAFPGRKAIDQAIEAGVKVLGNTAHFIDQGMDTGPIIMQSIVPISIFQEQGYDGVLDKQINMLYQIFDFLLQEDIKVVENVVQIENAEYKEVVYLPTRKEGR